MRPGIFECKESGANGVHKREKIVRNPEGRHGCGGARRQERETCLRPGGSGCACRSSHVDGRAISERREIEIELAPHNHKTHELICRVVVYKSPRWGWGSPECGEINCVVRTNVPSGTRVSVGVGCADDPHKDG